MELDLITYLDLLLDNTMEELEETYQQFPAIIKRLHLLNDGLKSHDISLDFFR